MADAFYVLASGEARVVKRREDGEEVTVNSLSAGEAFGEIALLERSTRSSTVRATGDVEVLRLDRAVFDALVKTHPELRVHLDQQIERHRLRDFLTVYTPLGILSRETLAASSSGWSRSRSRRAST